MTTMTRDQFAGLYKTLIELKCEGYNKFVLFALDKNKKKLTEVIKDLQEHEQKAYTEDYKSFEDARVIIAKRYAVKDESGEIVVSENGTINIDPTLINEANEEFTALAKTYEATLKEYETSVGEFRKYLLETIDIDFTKISFVNIPNTLSQEEYNVLSVFLKETEEDLAESL